MACETTDRQIGLLTQYQIPEDQPVDCDYNAALIAKTSKCIGVPMGTYLYININ